MNRNRIFVFALSAVFMAATGCTAASTGEGGEAAEQQAQKAGTQADPSPASEFSGRAVALKATGSLLNADLADTGALDPTGGDKTNTLLTLDLPGLLHAEALRAEAHGAGSMSQSEAELARLRLLGIEADLIKAVATAQCDDSGPKVSGETYVAELRINGRPTPIPIGPNQVIEVPGIARVVLNEQTESTEGDHASITVNALHVTLLNSEDIYVSQAEADITCGCGCGSN